MKDQIDSLKALYEENGIMMRDALDWRHKIILRYFTTVGALLVLAKWMNDSGNKKIIWIPFALGFISSIVYLLMHKVTSHLISICGIVGSDLEEKMVPGTTGYYRKANEWYKNAKLRNTTVWNWIYLLSALSFLIISIFFIFSPPK